MDIVNKIKKCKKNSNISLLLSKESNQSKMHLLTLKIILFKTFKNIKKSSRE